VAALHGSIRTTSRMTHGLGRRTNTSIAALNKRPIKSGLTCETEACFRDRVGTSAAHPRPVLKGTGMAQSVPSLAQRRTWGPGWHGSALPRPALTATAPQTTKQAAVRLHSRKSEASYVSTKRSSQVPSSQAPPPAAPASTGSAQDRGQSLRPWSRS
jgi:hypothetical protein